MPNSSYTIFTQLYFLVPKINNSTIQKISYMKDNKLFQLPSIYPSAKHRNIDDLSQSTRFIVKKLLGEMPAQQKNIQRQINYPNQLFIFIHPEKSISTIWILIFICTFYAIQYQISFSIAFGNNFFANQLGIQNVDYIIYRFILAILIIDCLVSFFRGYYEVGIGKVTTDWRKIMKHYLSFQFIIDIIVIIIYIVPLLTIGYGLDFIQLIPAFLLWRKKGKYQQDLIKINQYNSVARAAIALLLVFMDAFLIANYGSCIFIGMDLLMYNQQFWGSNTAYYWLTNNTSYPYSLIGGLWYYIYIYGQEFSVGTLSTLAPGPFAKNPFEALLAIFLMLILFIFASYVGEVLIQIVYTYSQLRIFHEANTSSMDNFLKLKQVDKKTRNRVYNFMELVWQIELKMESKQQQNLLNKLPRQLKTQLLVENGFAKSIYFIQYLTTDYDKICRLISLKIKSLTVDSESIILKNQSYMPKSLFFIKQGIAKFYLQTKAQNSFQKVTINLSHMQKFLGTYEFLTKTNYFLGCTSIDLCLLQKLDYDDFAQIIISMNLKEQLWMLTYYILVQQNLTLINRICLICSNFHLETKCPSLNYSPTLNSEHQMTQTHQRKINKRNTSKSHKIFINNKNSTMPQSLDQCFHLKNQHQDIEVVNNYDKYFMAFNLF